MFALIATMISSCAPREEPPTVLVVPDLLVPDCLAGLDPQLAGVSARKRGKLSGYKLDLKPMHPLRYAGFEDGDFVYSVNGQSLRMADVSGQRRCSWQIRRMGREQVLHADLVSWPAPEAPRPLPDSTVVVSRTALALALVAVPEYLPEAYSEGAYYPHDEPTLRELMLAAGLPEGYAVNAGGKKLVRNGVHLVDVVASLLSKEEADFVLRDLRTGDSRGLRVLATGSFPRPPDPSPLPLDRREVHAEPEQFQAFQEIVSGWTQNQKVSRATIQLHRGEDGHFDGYRLSGILHDSPLDELGFRNGDVLLSIEGRKVRNRKELHTAGELLQDAGRVEFALQRRGKPLTLIVDVLECAP